MAMTDADRMTTSAGRSAPGASRSTGNGWLVSVGAFAAGVVILPAGLGLALPHAVKTGLSVTTLVSGLVAMAASGLLVFGVVGMVRRIPLWGRFVVVPLAVVVTLVAGYSIGYAVAATHVPRTTVGSVTPADHGLPYRDVQFRTGDGVTLSGWYVASEGEAGVVLLHGAGNTRSDVLDHAVVLARHGYHVLLFDARGHGRSGGTAMDFGWYGDADVSAAVTFLQGQPGIDGRRIGVVGMSMGGEEAIGAAAADPRIRAVVAEGATGRVSGDLSWLSDEYGWRGAVQERLSGLMFGVTKVLTEAEAPITLRDAVAQADVPVLMIAAGDVADEARAGRFVQDGSPTTVDLWVVPDAGHTAGLDTDPVEWTQRVSGFLDAALAAGDE